MTNEKLNREGLGSKPDPSFVHQDSKIWTKNMVKTFLFSFMVIVMVSHYGHIRSRTINIWHLLMLFVRIIQHEHIMLYVLICTTINCSIIIIQRFSSICPKITICSVIAPETLCKRKRKRKIRAKKKMRKARYEIKVILETAKDRLSKTEIFKIYNILKVFSPKEIKKDHRMKRLVKKVLSIKLKEHEDQDKVILDNLKIRTLEEMQKQKKMPKKHGLTCRLRKNHQKKDKKIKVPVTIKQVSISESTLNSLKIQVKRRRINICKFSKEQKEIRNFITSSIGDESDILSDLELNEEETKLMNDLNNTPNSTEKKLETKVFEPTSKKKFDISKSTIRLVNRMRGGHEKPNENESDLDSIISDLFLNHDVAKVSELFKKTSNSECLFKLLNLMSGYLASNFYEESLIEHIVEKCLLNSDSKLQKLASAYLLNLSRKLILK